MTATESVEMMRSRLSGAKRALLEKHLRGQAGPGESDHAIKRLAATEAPLSYNQKRLWFLWSLEPDSALYNMGFLLRFRGMLDVAAVRRSLDRIVNRHEVLRTRIEVHNGEPRQVIEADNRTDIQSIDLTKLPSAQRTAMLEESARELAQQAFELSVGPLLRLQLVKLDSADHALVLVLHHSISDAWSLSVLVREFAVLYPALRDGRADSLMELPVQYADYAVWQRQYLQGARLEQHLDYWRNQLSGAPSALNLPTDFPQPATPTGSGAAYRMDLPQPLSEGIQRLCRDNDVTLFMTLAAAFNILLSRHTGETDICIGFPVSNRPAAELEDLIGFFVNTLVLRTDLSGNPCASDILARVREATLGSQAHQDLPFEKLVEVLRPKRQAGRNPLFQVMLVLQNTFSGTLQLPGLNVEARELELPVAKFDLTLMVAERQGCLHCVFEYSTDLFLERTIARWASHWQTLLEGIVTDPRIRLSELPILTDSERRQLVAWNATEAHIKAGASLNGLFETQAARNPDAVAVVHGKQRFSYDTLNRRANQLAHALRQKGVRSEVRVGLCLESALDMIVGILGILKAGGAYVPVDAAYPPQRQAEILDDARAALVVTQQDRLAALSFCDIDLFLLDQQHLAGYPDGNPAMVCHPESAAYLIYTSGSTGRPKGVVVSHRNAVHSTATRFAYYGQSVRGFLLLSSYAFDSSVAGIFWTLSQGGRLCIPLEENRHDPLALGRLIAEERLSHVLCLPSLYGLLLDQAESSQLSRLDVVIVAGEACPRRIVAEHYAQLPSTNLHNEYGPTEGTVWSSVHRIQAEEGQASHSIPIGRPIDNTQIHLLDDHLGVVPVGVPGELYIGGAGVARGYHGQPRLTAERFVPDPFATSDGGRLYRTGDRALYREDGVIEFLGRGDHQVKIRGYRIELGEIEARLLAHSSVKEVAVLVREARPGEKRLIAYLVPHDPVGTPEDSDALTELVRSALKTGLPEYMIPSVFVVLEEMPRTPNGKLDREALPGPNDFQRSVRQLVQARNPVEARLVALWSEVLGTETIGIHDNFFESGGDSILAIQLISRARTAGFTLSPRHLFQYQTVAELATVTDQTVDIQAEQGLVSGDVPLLPIQRWFFDRNLPNPSHWNQSVLLEVRESMDAAMVEQAIKHLIVHHDALRMRFRQEDGVWIQTCLPNEPCSVFHPIDLTRLSSEQQSEHIEIECERWHATLNLTAGPLLRVVWFDLGVGRQSRLLFIIHHLVVDGVSWRILIEDLHTACDQLIQDQTVILPAKTTSFKEWANRLGDYVKSEALSSARIDFSNIQYGQIKPVPVDMPEGNITESTTEILTVFWDRSNTRLLLQGFPSTDRITAGDMLLATLTITLTAWNNNDSILINLEEHGREELFEDVDLSRTTGWFTALYPQLLRCPGKGSVIERLISIKRQLTGVRNKGISYGIARYLSCDSDFIRKSAKHTEAQVTFNYFGQFGKALMDGKEIFSVVQDFNSMDFDPAGNRVTELGIDARIVDDRLRIDWNYSKARYHRATIEVFANGHLRNLEELVSAIPSCEELPWYTLIPKAYEQEYSDLISDAVLDENIRPSSRHSTDTFAFDTVLLTGSTGFVGAFLLEELISNTDAVVYCLIRAKDGEEAAKRLFDNLNKYHISIERKRIILLCGDLSKPKLGLSTTSFHELSLTLDAIIHNGALTNLIQPYHALRQANVLGTKEIIQLACLNKVKPIHYISTLSIFGEAESGTNNNFCEDDVPDVGPWLTMGYAQSKWVAEQLIRTAGERGCPVAVYRLGTVTGHSKTGAWNTEDFQFRLFASSIALGTIPEISDTVDMTPVDYVARAVIFLSQRAEAIGQTFHIVNPNPLPVSDFVELLNDIGHPVHQASYGLWKKEMVRCIGSSPAHPLYPFLPMFEDGPDNKSDSQRKVLEQRFDCQNTLRMLARSQISCRRIDAELMTKYISYITHSMC